MLLPSSGSLSVRTSRVRRRPVRTLEHRLRTTADEWQPSTNRGTGRLCGQRVHLHVCPECACGWSLKLVNQAAAKTSAVELSRGGSGGFKRE